jgi:hypothetical protein
MATDLNCDIQHFEDRPLLFPREQCAFSPRTEAGLYGEDPAVLFDRVSLQQQVVIFVASLSSRAQVTVLRRLNNCKKAGQRFFLNQQRS